MIREKKIPSLPLVFAMASWLEESGYSLATLYQLGVRLFHFYKTKQYKERSLRIRKDLPVSQDLSRIVVELRNQGILKDWQGLLPGYVFAITGGKKKTEEEILCSMAPFTYLSHLSAMDFHGLTNRIPHVMTVSTPPSRKMKELIDDMVSKDFGSKDLFNKTKFSRPLNYVPEIINKISIRAVPVYDGSGIVTPGEHTSLRVATVGRTFFDMLRESEYCGGMHHVIEMYREHAEGYVNDIVLEFERHGNKIDKVRAGYVLEERCGLRTDTILSWRRFVQRGGSRKLDPKAEYKPTFSEKWCLSINI